MKHVIAAGILCHDPEVNRILLVRRVDCGLWSVPGGLIETNESVAMTALREFHEETGVRLHQECLEWIGTNPVIGRDFHMGLFLVRTARFKVTLDGEHSEAVWFYVPRLVYGDLPDLYPGMEEILRQHVS